MKSCSKCGKQKILEEFRKDKYQKDGYTNQCKPCRNLYGCNYARINKIKRKEQNKNWYIINRARNAAYRKEQRKNHSTRILHNIRVRLTSAFAGKGKSKKTLSLLGCTLDIAKQSLESLFQPGMSWENYGQWEIDHKIPFASAKNLRDLENLCHYTNLQPLWKSDNRRKGCKIKYER